MYNQRGYPISPESTSLDRRLTHAQNDILATCGVCIVTSKDGNGPRVSSGAKNNTDGQKASIRRVVAENRMGLFLGTADIGLYFIGSWWINSLRHRLQVCLKLVF